MFYGFLRSNIFSYNGRFLLMCIHLWVYQSVYSKNLALTKFVSWGAVLLRYLVYSRQTSLSSYRNHIYRSFFLQRLFFAQPNTSGNNNRSFKSQWFWVFFGNLFSLQSAMILCTSNYPRQLKSEKSQNVQNCVSILGDIGEVVIILRTNSISWSHTESIFQFSWDLRCI